MEMAESHLDNRIRATGGRKRIKQLWLGEPYTWLHLRNKLQCGLRGGAELVGSNPCHLESHTSRFNHIIPELMSQMDISLYLHWSPCIESPISVWVSHCSQSYLLGTSVAFLLENSAQRIKASFLSGANRGFSEMVLGSLCSLPFTLLLRAYAIEATSEF